MSFNNGKISTPINEKIDRPYLFDPPLLGGWSPLKGNSPFITKSIECTIDYLASRTSIEIPDDVKVSLIASAAQIVSGINVYLELSIEAVRKYYVRSIIYTPVSGESANVPQIRRIFFSDKQIV
jgi:hypothetical protein